MRVLILTPTAFPSIAGNAVTAERWRRALSQKGITVGILASEVLDPVSFLEHLNRFDPDVIHVHHAFRSGSLLLNPHVEFRENRAAIVVSPGGTDLNVDLATSDRRETVLRIFQMARIIIVQNPDGMQYFRQYLPDLEERIVRVPKTVCWFGDETVDLRNIAGWNSKNVLFLHPAGIRPVKGNIECLKLMKRLHALRPEIRFVAAGPVVDVDYAERFEQEINRLAVFARWIKAIPSTAMRSAYEASDIVLNTSFSEGLSNCLLEAIAAGRPVLASDIPGNRWPVLGENGDAQSGCLFDPGNEDDFIAKALKLIDDESFRESLGRAAHLRKSHWPSMEDEANGLIAAYQSALN
jgi:glycosyltransferase involved in cell wall biosynthesis